MATVSSIKCGKVLAAAAAVTLACTSSAWAKKDKDTTPSGGGTTPPASITVTATALDLTAANTTGTVTTGDAIFSRNDDQTTGTGVLRPFVRLQSPGNSTTEQGYNTDYRKLQFDENTSPQFTRSMLISDLATFQIGDVEYYKFVLDINEPDGASEELLSLDVFDLYQGSAPDLHNYDPTTKFGADATLAFSLDATIDQYVKLDANLSSRGSGAGDMYAYVPTSYFTGSGDYLYLFSRFGDHFGAEGGFEEWAGITGPSDPPAQMIPLPPAAWMGLATMGVMAGCTIKRRLRLAVK